MPYFGVKVDLEKVEVTIKLHGPLDTFVINTLALKKLIFECAATYFEKSDNIPGLTFSLAEEIKFQYLNGNDLIWVEVEALIRTNGVFFGASAEQVLVDTPG